MIKKGLLTILVLILISCSKNDENPDAQNLFPAYQITQTVSFNDVSVDLVIDKPMGNEFDVLMVFHGTVGDDSLILDAAYTTLNAFKNLLVDKNMLIISVAYPEENLLFGDNLQQCEAALLWLKNNAASELNISINKIFLAGHSQGGYLATRLNVLHQTNGVIANAPGPLNLVYRCELEESGQIGSGQTCMLLNQFYGSTSENPDAYFQRSLLNYTSGFKSDQLFVQGLNDSPIQMYSWPTYKENLLQCNDCQLIQFLELPDLGHQSLFNSPQAKTTFNNFINERR